MGMYRSRSGTGPKRVLRIAIDKLHSRHWPTGIDSQFYGEHFVKVGPRVVLMTVC